MGGEYPCHDKTKQTSELTISFSYGCQNSKALNGLLKEELGFQGYVMSDWAATHTGVSAIEAGLVSSIF
jgi:beta-glucosidase-like glycosyl hydrolase